MLDAEYTVAILSGTLVIAEVVLRSWELENLQKCYPSLSLLVLD